MASVCPVSIKVFGSMSPFDREVDRGPRIEVLQRRRQFLTVLPSAMSLFDMTIRSARIACLRASGAFSRFSARSPRPPP